MQLPHSIRRLIAPILELLYPPNCLICNKIEHLETARHLCGECFSEIDFISHTRCASCSCPLYGAITKGSLCAKCRDKPLSTNKGMSCFHLSGVGRSLIHAFKYEQGLYLKNDILEVIKKTNSDNLFFSNATLVPVPLHPRKYRERGYNQSMLLSQYLTRIHKSLKISDLIIKNTDTLSQALLNKKERSKNTKKAFAISPKTTISANIRYIIVDDVFTTGSTINACAQALKKAGAQHIDFFTLAQG